MLSRDSMAKLEEMPLYHPTAKGRKDLEYDVDDAVELIICEGGHGRCRRGIGA
jgi:hypothetical protein